MDLSGIFPPIPTPFNQDEEIDYVKLKENVQKWNEIPFKGKITLTQHSGRKYRHLHSL